MARKGFGNKRVRAASAIVLPLLIIAAYMFALRPPDTSTGEVVNVTKGWMTFPGIAGDNAHALDGRKGNPVTMPGTAPNGPGPGVTWIRRKVDLTPEMRGEPLMFFLGDIRTSIATVYWNGHRVGRQAAGPNGIKMPPYGSTAFNIPPAFVTPGSNTLDLRIEYVLAADAGFSDTRNFVGKESILAPFAAHYMSVETWIPSGANLIFVSLGIVIIALWVIEKRLGEKNTHKRYLNTLLMLLCGGAYQVIVKGTIFTQWLPSAAAGFATHSIVIGLGFIVAIDFAEQFWLNRSAWFGRLSHAISVVFMAAIAYHLAYSPPDKLLDVYLIYGGWGLIAIVYACGLGIVMMSRTKRDFGVIVLSMFVVTLATGASDLIREYTFHTVSLFRAGVTLQAILAAAVAIGGFLQMGARNLQLSGNLSEANVRLRNALDRAEESTTVKAEFLAHISHEVRTPLNAIVNLPEAVIARFVEVPAARCGACGASFELDVGEKVTADVPCPSCHVPGKMVTEPAYRFRGNAEETWGDLGLLQSASQHLLHVFNDILDISRLEANATELRRESTNPADVVNEAVMVAAPMAHAADVKLVISVQPPPPPPIEADKLRLIQVLVNLISNAIKFSPAGSTVTITLRTDGDQLFFAVRDEGVGIAPENHRLVFESFRQVDAGHTRKAGGSGLGLAITKHLVALHGGTIWVESELGKGAVFHVQLPTKPPSPSTPPPPFPSLVPPTRSPNEGNGGGQGPAPAQG